MSLSRGVRRIVIVVWALGAVAIAVGLREPISAAWAKYREADQPSDTVDEKYPAEFVVSGVPETVALEVVEERFVEYVRSRRKAGEGTPREVKYEEVVEIDLPSGVTRSDTIEVVLRTPGSASHYEALQLVHTGRRLEDLRWDRFRDLIVDMGWFELGWTVLVWGTYGIVVWIAAGFKEARVD